MNHSGLATKLKLAYSPVSNFDFTHLKSEKVVQEILDDSMLYIIAQRPLLTFENINKSDDGKTVLFEIQQQGTGIKVNCSLQVYQPCLGNDPMHPVNLEFGFNDPNSKQTSLPLNNVHGFKIYDHNMDFLVWFSPDKFLHNYFNKLIEATIDGDYRALTSYKVHYVGKATDQEIWKRLTGHSSLQDILSLERPFHFGTLPTYEIVLLLFRVSDKLTVNVFDGSGDINDFVNKMIGNNTPSDKDISLDAEKALIKLLSPDYNDRKFPKYSISKDGLYKYKFNRYAYQISENLTLKYKEGEILCSVDNNKSDLIIIEDNKNLSILKHDVSL